jgi:hypothetical protein
MLWHLDVRDREVGGPVLPARLVYPDGADQGATLDALAIQSSVTILIHGFNVNRTSGHAQLTELARWLADSTSTSAFLALTWPGDSWAGPAGYPLEGNDADDAAAEVAKFIQWAIPSGVRLSFISHSLGARVVFETIKALPASYPIGEVCVMAAAIDDSSVSAQWAYRNEVARASRVAVLASERDNVLRWAYPLGDWIQAFLFFWKDVPDSALGYHGPRGSGRDGVPGNVKHVQIATSCGVDHGDYLGVNPLSPLETRAAAFAAQVLNNDPELRY